MEGLAQQLISLEASTPGVPLGDVPPVFRVIERLRHSLSVLVGVAGFRALLARALALVKVQVPSMCALHVTPDGSLEGARDLAVHAEAGAVLLTKLLELLAAFIGERMVMRILQDLKPEFTPLGTALFRESEHESIR